MKKKSVLVTSFLSLGAAGAFAQATPAPAAPEPMVPLTANINVTTKYKFRGQDQGESRSTPTAAGTKWFTPAIQGGFDWSSSGFYVGNWNSNIGFTNAGIEMDFYGGYKGEITKDFGFDVGILQYYYPQKDKVGQLRHHRAVRGVELDLRHPQVLAHHLQRLLRHRQDPVAGRRLAQARRARTPATSS